MFLPNHFGPQSAMYTPSSRLTSHMTSLISKPSHLSHPYISKSPFSCSHSENVFLSDSHLYLLSLFLILSCLILRPVSTRCSEPCCAPHLEWSRPPESRHFSRGFCFELEMSYCRFKGFYLNSRSDLGLSGVRMLSVFRLCLAVVGACSCVGPIRSTCSSRGQASVFLHALQMRWVMWPMLCQHWLPSPKPCPLYF